MECCFIVTVENKPRLFSSVVVFFPFEFPDALVHSPQTAQPYRPNPGTVFFSVPTTMSQTAVNYSCAYEISSPLFLGFSAGGSPAAAAAAAALLFLPSLLQFSLHSLSRHGQVNTERQSAPSMTSSIGAFEEADSRSKLMLNKIKRDANV